MYFLVLALTLWNVFLAHRLYKLFRYPDSTEYLAPEEPEEETKED